MILSEEPSENKYFYEIILIRKLFTFLKKYDILLSRDWKVLDQY